MSVPEDEAAGSPEGGVLLELRDVARDFDVSRPWLDRLLAGRPRQYLRAVDGISFDIRRGETLALVGESGCGKSTLARLIAGLHAPSRGTIVFEGIDLGAQAPSGAAATARRRMQMVFQDPYASLNPRWRVGRSIAEPIVAGGLERDRARIRDRVTGLLEQVGLSAEDAARYPHEFSGGQRQRVSIARALSANPDFLICDEPTSALDVSVQAQILNLMGDLRRRFGLTMLFISHNLAVVAHVADRVGVMYLGRLVELADARKLFRAPAHPYTRMLIDAVPDLAMTGHPRTAVAGEVPDPLDPPRGCAFHPRCPLATDRCRREQPHLAAIGPGSRVACHAREEGRLG